MSEGATLQANVKVFVSLLVLTVITVVVAAWVDIGVKGNTILAILIAVTKATLVASIFMHLKWERKALYVVVGFPLVLMLIIVCALSPDCVLRNGHKDRPVAKVSEPH